ncbi:MAG: ROK family protein, partial [Mariprofundaceae bacterium]|nr:ROK family protein [Mariprofundaceae bacterium]
MRVPLALGIDVGGTNIRLAVVDEQGDIIENYREQAQLSQHGIDDAAKSAKRVLDVLAGIIRPLLEKHAGIQGIGIGFPGFFDTASGLLLSSPNIPGLLNFPLGEQLGKRLACPVHAQNDASVAALGEFCFGVGQGAFSLLHLTLGTGVGGGIIIIGQLYGGDGGMAMEVGHLHIVPEDRLCGCGARGCLETWASATAVAERFTVMSGIQADARAVARLA